MLILPKLAPPRRNLSNLSKCPRAAWSLIELMIGLAVTASLLALAAPDISAWISNTQIRTAAESIQNGLQMARAEAVKRNTTVSFYLTDGVDAGCALSGVSSNWVVALNSPVGACNDNTNVVQRHPASEGSTRTVVSAAENVISFNGLGRMTSGAISICVGMTNVGVSCTGAQPEQQLAVQVSPGGQIRMCSMTRPADDPQRCPS